MPVDKSQFIKQVKDVFTKGMNDAFVEGMKAGIKSESPVFSDETVTAEWETTIQKMAQTAADAATKIFVDDVTEKLVDAIDAYIKLILKNTVSTTAIVTSGNGAGGSVTIKPGDLHVQ